MNVTRARPSKLMQVDQSFTQSDKRVHVLWFAVQATTKGCKPKVGKLLNF